jgi:hypothetical protein
MCTGFRSRRVRMTITMKCEFANDAAMYYGSIRVGDVELVFDKNKYIVSYIVEDGIFPFVYDDSFARYPIGMSVSRVSGSY